MDVAFNEGALDSYFVSQTNENYDKSLESFLKTVLEMKRLNLLNIFYVPNNIWQCNLSDEHTISSWLNDSNISKEHQRFFRRLIDKAEFVDEILDGDTYFLVEDKKIFSKGAKFASNCLDVPVIISVLTHQYWEQENVNCINQRLDDDLNLIEQKISILNISEKSDLANFEKDKTNKIHNHIASGQDLWEKREKLFSNLTFCESVKEQLYENPDRGHVLCIIKRLKRLQDYFAVEHDIYDPKELGMNARPEADSVKNDPNLKKYRKFKLPSGEEHYFFDHIGFSSPRLSGGRIYFLPDIENKNCYIGYIGKHLPTKKY